MRSAVLGLAHGCHPGPTVAVTTLVTVLAAATGRDATGVALVAAAVLTGQLSVGWSNDYLDAARDSAVGRRDKPTVNAEVSRRALAIAAVSAAVLCVPLSLMSGVLAGVTHLIGVAAGWGYNVVLKRTWWSWLPYLVAFGFVPAFVTLGLPGHPWPPGWATGAAALLGVAAHLANVLPDIDDDLTTGVRGFPQRLGKRGVRLIAPVLVTSAAALLVFGPNGAPGLGGWLVLVASGSLTLVGFGTRTRHALFRAVIAAATLDVVVLLLHGAALT